MFLKTRSKDSTGASITRNRLLRGSGFILLLLSMVGMSLMAFVGPKAQAATTSKLQKFQTTVTNPVPFGTNAGFSFVDAIKNGPRFDSVPGTTGDVAKDAAGWPQSDFMYIIADARHNMPWNGPDFNGVNVNLAGTYHLSFTGQATLTTSGTEGGNSLDIQHQAYDSANNKTSADLVVHNNSWLLEVVFSQTKRQPGDTAGNGVTDMHLITPGYPADTTQVFRTDYLDVLKQASPTFIRTFANGTAAYNIWNGTHNVIPKWSDRSLPTDAYWPLPSRNTGDIRGFDLPWEYLIELCNELNTDAWVMVPVTADDAYITELAKLFKNGDSFTPGLKSGLHLYLEDSDENWNFQFSQAVYNQIEANAEGISLLQREVEKTVQIGQDFTNVYGSGSFNTIIRPVAPWQYNNGLDVQDALTWAQTRFNAPVKQLLYGIGEAPYLDPQEPTSRSTDQEYGLAPYPDPADANDVNRIVDTLYTEAGSKRKVFTAWETIATNFGIHEVGYESGPSLVTGISADVGRSPRMADVITQYFLNDYFATGADQVGYFSLGDGAPSDFGDWYTFESYQNLNDPRYQGFLNVAQSSRPAITVGSVLPWNVNDSVGIEASQRITGSSKLDSPDTSESVGSGAYLDYLLRAPADGTYSIKLTGHSNNSAAQVQIAIDNHTLNTVSLPQTTNGDSSTVSVTLTPGLHTLILSGVGNGSTTFDTSNSITVTLTSGGGSAIVPSAPLNVTSQVTTNQVKLKWENVTTATSYTIKRSTTSGGSYTSVGTSSTPDYTDTNVNDDTTYYYTVTASNSAGESALSPQIAVIPTQPVVAAAPSNFTTTSGGASSYFGKDHGEVRISWTAVPNAVSYNVKRGTSSDGPFTKLQGQTSTIYYDSSLTNGTTYYYVITSVNTFGESGNSSVIRVTPQISAPAAPTNLVVTAGSGSVSLKWLQPPWLYPDFTPRFNIKRSASTNGPFTTVFSTSTNNGVDYDLTGEVNYCYVITALNSAGESAESTPQCATPTNNGTPTPSPTATPGSTPTPTATPGSTPTPTATPGVTPTPTGTTLFSTGFESADAQPTWTNTVDGAGYPAGGVSNVGGICCGLTGPEAGTRTETAHQGNTALMYSGNDSSDSSSYAYLQVLDLSSKDISVASNTTLEYWIFPQSSSNNGLARGSNSTCVALDLIFSDSNGNLSNLRDSGAVDQNGNRAHPGFQCNQLTLDSWNHVVINLGTHSNGLKVLRIDLGYDQPSNTGGYRGYVDDISIHN